MNYPFANAQAGAMGEVIFRADTGEVVATVRYCANPSAFTLRDVTRIDVREYHDRTHRRLQAGDTVQLDELGYWEGEYPCRNYVNPVHKELA